MPSLVPPHPHVVVHGIDSADRPEFATFVFDLCARPLPAWATDRIRLFDPDRDQDVTMADHCELDAQDPSHLSDVVDVIFLVVSRARRWGAHPRDFSSLLLFTVAACVSAISKDAVVSDDTWVALRRVPAALADLGHLADKYLLNPMVVFLPLPYNAKTTEEATPPAVPEPTPPVSDASSPSCPASEADLTLSAWLARPWKITLPTYEYVCDDGPPAPTNPVMHRVASAAKPPRHLLSVLVVSSCKEIYDAVSSALYQRLSWNLRTPILGISFAPDSDVVRVLVAWLEPSTQDYDELPRVHVLHAACTLTHSNVESGLFSLRNPADALVLARLLLSLSDTFANDSRNCQLLELDAVPNWRADQLPVHDDSSVSKWSRDSIQHWISRTEGPVEATDSEAGFSSTPEQRSRELESDSTLSVDHCRRYSFAEFVALRERQNRMPTGTSLWMIDRYIRQHCLPSIYRVYDEDAYSSLRDELQPHIALFISYRSATRFSWPTKWTSLDCLPAVPASVAPLAQDLFQSYHAAVQPHCVASPLSSPEITLRLQTELATILHVCALAKSLHHASASQRYRFCYDMLLSVLSPCNDVRARSNVALRLSRNEYVDDIRRYPQEKATSFVKGSGVSHRLVHFWEIDTFEDGDTQHDVLKRAHSLLAHDLTNWPSGAQDTLKRVRSSPTTGTCDLAIIIGAPLRPRNTLVEQHESLIVEQTEGPSFLVPLIPCWTTAESFSGNREKYRSAACDIFASVHYDYPSAATCKDSNIAVPTPGLTTAADEKHPVGNDAKGAQRDIQMGDPVMNLSVPVLIVVHSVQRTRFDIADSNRLRICLTSTARYLGFLGVFDFPVFGLLTEGKRSAVVMAWAEDLDGFAEIQYMDQHCCAYDISDPAGAFNLTTFLLWLQHEHTPRLASILDDLEPRSSSHSDVKMQADSLCTGWSMADQIRDLKEASSLIDTQQGINVGEDRRELEDHDDESE